MNRYFLFASLLLVSATVSAADGFEKIRCDTDIAKAIVGHRMGNERVSVIEARHKILELQNLGASEVSKELTAISWKICGEEFLLLQKGKESVVADALKLPEHSKDKPEFGGHCSQEGKEMPGYVVAILTREAGTGPLAASSAWRIDEKTAKFVELPVQGLRCPRNGISTVDGGM